MKLFRLLIFVLCLIPYQACNKGNGSKPSDDRDLTIVILHDNDVHSAIEGYAQFAGYKDAILAADTAHVLTVSSGDFIQGAFCGAYSKGSYPIEVIKSVGYDAMTLGNHEFDFGIARQQELLDILGKDKITSSNFINTETEKGVYTQYIIKKCGTKKIAFVGVTTPAAAISCYLAFYDGQKRLPYDLPDKETVSLVQAAVNEARSNGADYVILLSHLGEIKDNNCELYSIPLINQTTGIDIVLDGHTHSLIPEQYVKNLDGKDILLTQTGTKFSHIGKVTITKSGSFHSQCIPDSLMKEYCSTRVQRKIDSVNLLCSDAKLAKIGHTAFDLTVNDENGQRLVRKGETNLCNLVCDAYMHITGSMVAIENGGAFRSGINAGDITYGNLMDALPFENGIVKFEVTGKQLTEALESAYSRYPVESSATLQVGGLKFTYDSTKNPHICDVQVLGEDGKYSAISESAIYTAATCTYVMHNTNSYPSLADCTIVKDFQIVQHEALWQYIKDLGGEIPERYRNKQNRVTFK